MLEDGDNGSSRQHFHLKGIMKQEKDSSKKLKRKRKRDGRVKDDAAPVDEFEIDLGDSRFSALYESHLYAPDPANPLYK